MEPQPGSARPVDPRRRPAPNTASQGGGGRTTPAALSGSSSSGSQTVCAGCHQHKQVLGTSMDGDDDDVCMDEWLHVSIFLHLSLGSSSSSSY